MFINQVLHTLPYIFLWQRSLYVNKDMADGMFKRKLIGMKAYASVRIAAGSAIFEVAAYGASHFGQLAANLMMAPCMKMHLNQIETFRLTQ